MPWHQYFTSVGQNKNYSVVRQSLGIRRPLWSMDGDIDVRDKELFCYAVQHSSGVCLERHL